MQGRSIPDLLYTQKSNPYAELKRYNNLYKIGETE